MWKKNREYNAMCKLDVSCKILTKMKSDMKVTSSIIVAGLLTADK